MRWQKATFVALMAFAFAGNAGSAKVIKVLPHFMDLKGRTAVNPSLFDRDAYQNELRSDPAKRSALRFDVQWKAPYYDYDALTLRIEARGMKGRVPTTNTIERPLRLSGTISHWTALKISGESYGNFGELISWRATLLSGTNMVAEQKSFLW